MPELLLPRLKREIAARLDELRPLVAEAERLEAAKAALLAEAAERRGADSAARGRGRGARANGGTARTAGAEPTARNEVGTRRGGAEAAAAPADEASNGHAPRGTNQTAILAIVEERPGVSVAEIASVTKIAKPTVATTVSKLKREGLLAEEAGGVKLASRQPVTLAHVAPARDEGVSDEEWDAARKGAAA
jgi:hypothetical protein